jgi:hypothetical protein
MTDNTLEEVFSLIEKGNALREAHKPWLAAAVYSQARQRLVEAAVNATGDDDQQQIQQLCHHQARDYLHRARESLLEALQAEAAEDRTKPWEEVTVHEALSAAEAAASDTATDDKKEEEYAVDTSLARLRLFARLFAQEDALLLSPQPSVVESTPAVADVAVQQLSLEDRLRALNDNLPSDLKTQDERMRDLHKGLNGLGVSLPGSSSNHKQELFEVHAKSESEQVEDILAQAQDEVNMMAQPSSSLSATDSTPLEVSETAPSSDLVQGLLHAARDIKAAAAMGDKEEGDSEADEDDSHDPGNPFVSSDLAFFQDGVNEAQSFLAQLNAMLDVEDDDNADIQFDPDAGKHALDSALRHLQEVQTRWKEAIKRSS